MPPSYPDVEYAAETLVTRRDRFLSDLETVSPRSARITVIEPLYPKGDHRGRAPVDLEGILQIEAAPQCFCLLGKGVANASYDLKIIRNFVEVELNRKTAPDATTLLKAPRVRIVVP